jgi:16S rRNA processing protein RimM
LADARAKPTSHPEATEPPSAEKAGAAEPIRLGYVARAHGLAGEIEVKLDWADSAALSKAARVVLEAPDGASSPYSVERTRTTPKGLLLSLRGVGSRDAAEALRGHLVKAPRDALPELAEGEYYLCDLVGLEVVAPEGSIGRVCQIQVYPSVDAVVIETASGAKFEQPLLDEWLAEVKLAERRLVLSSSGGLIEIPSKPARAPESSVKD